ncbi:MAG: acyclic terpene utilization AtuA family protein [Rhodospirillaceae bacterium]|nr:acyclic terpene utilization AtuA family protein [Rhodospirillaceae bacterium]
MIAPKSTKFLSASGQLGYGIPVPALERGIAHEPDMIGADMGSVDPGPAYLGMGRMATDPTITKRDLTLVLEGARALDVPLVLGSAGTAGARPHLDAAAAIIREIAAEKGLSFKLATIAADIPHDRVLEARRADALTPLGAFEIPSEDEIRDTPHIVAQMGEPPIAEALAEGADVIIAGRACDTAIYSAFAASRGHDRALSAHMAKIIECASLCCDPGGRDAMLATLDADGFVLDSMNASRNATPTSVAAHALYEQADPYTVTEPDGILDLSQARYEAVDEHRVRVSGAQWTDTGPSLKLEGAAPAGHRTVYFAGSSDPRVIARIETIWAEVRDVVSDLAGDNARELLRARFYGLNGVIGWPDPPEVMPREIGILIECVAPTAERAKSVLTVAKQYLLHHGFPGRLSTAGNIAFPFTPPELDAGPAWRFSLHHVMPLSDARELKSLFPITYEDI